MRYSCFTGTALEGHLREFEVDFLAGELLVDRAEGLSLVLNVGLLSLVQMHLEQAGPVQADPAKAHNISVFGSLMHHGELFSPDPLANNFCRVDQVIQNGSVDSHEGARPGH